MGSVRIELLGGFRVTVDGRSAVVLDAQARALLAYLACVPGPHERYRLVAMLWGESADGPGGASFCQALSTLRLEIPGALLEERGIGLAPPAVDLDVAAFERLAGEESQEALEEAVALYQGGLLEGVDVQAGAAFQQWRAIERARLHALALSGMMRLLALHLRMGAVAAGIRVAHRVLGLDPLLEAAHRTLMRLYAQAGQCGAALRQYEACVDLLRRERDSEPERSTRGLFVDILEMASGAGAPATPPTGATRDTPQLAGRQAEMAELRRALQAAWRGHPCVVTVLGGTGIGKSRLAAEVASDALARGGLVLFGGAHGIDPCLPLRPWIDALRQGAMAIVADTAALYPQWGAELRRVFPELAGARTEPAPGGTPRLFEALSHVVTRLVSERPLVVILEDLHWADEMSLRLLAFIAQRMGGQRGLILVTARDDGKPSGPFRQTMDELDRGGRRVRLRLAPLFPETSLELVQSVLGARGALARAPLAEWIRAAGGGIPAALVEMTWACQELGAPEGAPGPERVRQILSRRLDRLGEPARGLVTLAAVVDGPFELPLLRHAAGLGACDVADGVEQLVTRRVLHVVGERLDFSHPLVRDLAYVASPPAVRRALHRAVGEALEAMWAGCLEAVVDRLAWHFSLGEDSVRAVQYLGRFARHAVRACAHGDAIRAIEQARLRIDRLPPDDPQRWRLELALQGPEPRPEAANPHARRSLGADPRRGGEGSRAL